MLVLGAVLEFFIMEPTELSLLDGVVGIEWVRGTIHTIVIRTALDLPLVALTSLLIWIAPGDSCSPDGWHVGASIGTRIGLLHDLILTTPLLSYGLKRRVGIAVGTRSYRSTSGVLACRRSAIALAPFLHLGSGDPDVSKSSTYHRSVI